MARARLSVITLDDGGVCTTTRKEDPWKVQACLVLKVLGKLIQKGNYLLRGPV